MVKEFHKDDPWQLVTGDVSPYAGGGVPIKIKSIGKVPPLDRQFGISPKKTVPDVLQDMMFGQPIPVETEVAAATGNAADVPPLETYAILDAAKVPNLLDLLGTSELEHRCLFRHQRRQMRGF